MPTNIEPFHERAFKFACQVVRLYMALSTTPAVPLYIARQALQAGTSIGANLEEARGAQTRRDLASKFSIALKEARETTYWLRLLTATGLVAAPVTEPLLSEAGELVAILTVARRKLNTSSG